MTPKTETANPSASSPSTYFITGSAGFIGFWLSRLLLTQGHRVIGLDAMTDYYDVSLKQARHAILSEFSDFVPIEDRLEKPGVLREIFATYRPDIVVHLAAQAGVRYSIDAPASYVTSNLVGTFELLEAARAIPPRHMMLASTSSAYGAVETMPYKETMKADLQMSFYAATKKANEAMAHSYAHLYGLPTTMFRFFTVYGPWGRPDMALFKFTKAILDGKPIDVYNNGQMRRDFTYVEDLVDAISLLAHVAPERPETAVDVRPGDSLSPVAPFRIVNIGNSTPVPLMTFIEAVETAIGKTADKNMMPMQPGDVPATWADTDLLASLIGGMKTTPVSEGVAKFVDWYRNYYQV